MSTPLAPLTFRIARPADLDAVVALLRELNRAEGNTGEADRAALDVALFGENPPVALRALLAIAGEETAAVALYYRGFDVLTTAYGYHLGDFLVAEKFRRRGIGRLLFAALSAQNLRESGEWISLTVLSKNKPATEFYKAIGMTHVAVDFYAAGRQTLSALSQRLLQN